ncbi:MAG: hypothetical protein KTR27_11965 [Leptolyngbyaceae cyanobacterium MAG.088]|nr:hypothetical protein [Leptolyngbyaceae cyanobacterium MAG.088]
MSILLILLFLLGIVLSLSGTIIGIVQAFQESVTWGLLYLLVPFAALVFVIKFWSRKWVRNSLFFSLGGAFMFVIGSLVSPMVMQQAYDDLDLDAANWEESGFEDTGAEASDPTTAAPAGTETNLKPAFDLAMQAATLTQTANTSDDWSLVADLWQQSIMVLESVPEGDPNYSIAKAKVTEYSGNLAYAQQNSLQ